jgi:hypothetical protein
MEIKERRNMQEIEKKVDMYSIKSANLLKTLVEKEIKGVFKNALRCIEMRFGRDFEGFETIRRDILRSGNDSIRKVSEMIDGNFNVEQIPDIHTINFKKG